jgi:predicted glycosyltransferase
MHREERADGPRIAIYTHDTYGLGHVRRCLHILRSVAERAPDAALLLLTGSPALGALGPLPATADCVKIPTLARTGAVVSRPPHLHLPLDQVTRLRRRLVRDAVLGFAPDVLLVDNFPLGSRRELRQLLGELEARATRTVLGLRDVVDLPTTVREHWARDGVYEVLERCYDRILVYGVREVLDVGTAYGLSAAVAEKVRYCGYVTSVAAATGRAASADVELGALGRPLVVASVGGGGDGAPLLENLLRALERLPRLSALVVTGPLMPPADRVRLAALAAGLPRVALREMVADLPTQMATADLVVAMAGYNTVAELLALGRPALLVPRTWRYGEHERGAVAELDAEQLLRAQALERAGLADLLHPRDLDPGTLAARIEAALARPRAIPSARFEMGGLERVTAEILELAGGNRGKERAHVAGATN